MTGSHRLEYHKTLWFTFARVITKKIDRLVTLTRMFTMQTPKSSQTEPNFNRKLHIIYFNKCTWYFFSFLFLLYKLHLLDIEEIGMANTDNLIKNIRKTKSNSCRKWVEGINRKDRLVINAIKELHRMMYCICYITLNMVVNIYM